MDNPFLLLFCSSASPHTEHFYHALVPWVHFVPVQENLLDLVDKIKWAKSNPEKARAIAEAGRKFVLSSLSTGSVACYWWTLLSQMKSMLKFTPSHALNPGCTLL